MSLHGPAQDRVRMVSGGTSDVIRQAALAVRDAAEAADGTSPFDEHTLLSLTPATHPATDPATGYNLAVLDRAEPPIAFAHLDHADGSGRPVTAEFAVHPRHRRRGHGRALLRELIDVHRLNRPDQEALQVWSHGDQKGARALATEFGFVVVRELRQLRRPLDGAELAVAALPPRVTLRSFRPGVDDAAWLAVNARAFAHHPEQGRTTQADLDARMAEDWFDPDGFLIAERDGAIAGFHWTKIHPASAGGERLGEVYVVGVDPAQHGGGLGRALTAAGLRYLEQQGVHTVLLYVESDNEPALALYRRLEFATFSTDVMYRSPADQDTGAR